MVNERLHQIAERVDMTVDELVSFLESPAGRRLRRYLATALIVSVPIVLRIPGLRRSPIGRLIEVGGGAALVVKLAELIRDWERSEKALPQPRVIDVPPASPAS
jgi:hypothetical protein